MQIQCQTCRVLVGYIKKLLASDLTEKPVLWDGSGRSTLPLAAGMPIVFSLKVSGRGKPCTASHLLLHILVFLQKTVTIPITDFVPASLSLPNAGGQRRSYLSRVYSINSKSRAKLKEKGCCQVFRFLCYLSHL